MKASALALFAVLTAVAAPQEDKVAVKPVYKVGDSQTRNIELTVDANGTEGSISAKMEAKVSNMEAGVATIRTVLSNIKIAIAGEDMSEAVPVSDFESQIKESGDLQSVTGASRARTTYA